MTPNERRMQLADVLSYRKRDSWRFDILLGVSPEPVATCWSQDHAETIVREMNQRFVLRTRVAELEAECMWLRELCGRGPFEWESSVQLRLSIAALQAELAKLEERQEKRDVR